MCPKASTKRYKSERALVLHMTQFPQCEAFSRSMISDGTGGWESSNRHTTTALKASVDLRRDYLNPYDHHLHGNINGPLAVTDSGLTSQEAGNSNIDGVENNPVTDFVDDDEGSNPFIDGMCDNWHNNAGAPSFSYTNDLKWTVALLKIVDDIKATDGAFGKILLWAREAASAQYSFYPQGGMSRNKNVENLVNSMENAKHLLPSVYTVPITEEANGPSVDVIAFDFVPQLLSLLQNRDIMTKENLLIDLQNDPLARYKSPGNLRGEALSGQVYQDAYRRLITDPKRQLFVPIIQWVDRTHVTGDGRFSLKPYMFSPAIFTEKFRRTFPAWGFHGYLPKEKASSAQNRGKKEGDNIRSYHAQLRAILSTFSTANSRLLGVELPIGPNGSMLKCDIVTCLLYVIQDIQEGDSLCGRFAPHTSKIQRQCRGCNVSFEKLDDPSVPCVYVEAARMHEISQSNDEQLRQKWSQHRVDNAFNHVVIADPVRGIMGATPTEIMHVFRNGMIAIVTYLVLENVPDSKKAALDSMAVRFHKRHRQTCRKLYPATDFSNGITNLTKISAAERYGLVFLFVILSTYDEGWQILDTTLQKKTTTNLRKVLELFEAMLCFDAWLRMPTFWSVDHEQQGKLDAVASIRKLMQMCKSRIPTDKSARWHFPKFHELLHIVEDIVRFGAPINYSAERPESLLIPAAKQPGRRSQKRHDGSSYERQAAQRLSASFMIATVYNKIFVSNPNKWEDDGESVSSNDGSDSDASNSCTTSISSSRAYSISQSTGQATFATSTTTIDINGALNFNVHWTSRTKKDLLTVPLPLLAFMYQQFGATVHFCTEYRRAEHIFRCHPCFQSDGPIYDWMKIRFEDKTYPSRLAAVVICKESPSEPYQLVVQCTTQETGTKSVLLTEWFMSDTYYVVSPDAIDAPCFVIETTDDNSKVQETLPIEDWPGCFTHLYETM